MSTTKLITIICWIVVAVVVIGLAVWFITGNLFGFSTGFKINLPHINIGSFDNLTGPYNEVGSYEIASDGVSSISVSWTSGNVSIEPYDGDVITLTEYARRELKDNEKLVYNTKGNTLEVHYYSPGLSLNIPMKKIEIRVPGALAEDMDILRVNATSADLQLSNFNVNTLDIDETSGTSYISGITSETSDIHSTSGTVTVENITATRLSAGTTSGSVKIDGGTADSATLSSNSGKQILSGAFKTVDASSTSGDIRFEGVSADSVTLNSSSGSQILSGAFKAVDASSTSGKISVTGSVNPDSMNCGTTSGGITVTIPGGSGIVVSYSTTSGRFSSDIPVITGGPAAYRFTSTSGNIWLKAA